MNSDQHAQLHARLRQSEDPWVERKSSFDERDVRRTIVGFANTVEEGQTAVLFIGAHNNSEKHKGVTDADALQMKVAGQLKRCYPPIEYTTCVLPITTGDGKQLEILAVLVGFSKNRPHFSGPAYVRRGSETLEASPEMFAELIASQNDKARRILSFKGKSCWLRMKSRSGFWEDRKCTVDKCDAHSVTVADQESYLWTFEIPSIEIKSTPIRPLEITAEPPYSESEHLRRMVERWSICQRPVHGDDYHLSIDWLVEQFIADPKLVLSVVAALADGSTNHWIRLLHLNVRFAAQKSDDPLPSHQKLRRLDSRFHELMNGQFEGSNSSNLSAAVAATIEVSRSIEDCQKFLKHLATEKPGVADLPWTVLWNALLYELRF